MSGKIRKRIILSKEYNFTKGVLDPSDMDSDARSKALEELHNDLEEITNANEGRIPASFFNMKVEDVLPYSFHESPIRKSKKDLFIELNTACVELAKLATERHYKCTLEYEVSPQMFDMINPRYGEDGMVVDEGGPMLKREVEDFWAREYNEIYALLNRLVENV